VSLARATMARPRQARRLLRALLAGALLCLALLSACSPDQLEIKPPGAATPRAGDAPRASAEPGGEEEQPDDEQEPAGESGGWQQAVEGIEWRRVQASDASGASDTMLIARVDPSRVRIRIAYDRVSPGRVGEWAGALKPLLVVNGGYFDDQGRATALVIHDGVAQGSSYEGFGGMFAVDGAGAISIRALRDQPYDPGETLAQAFQSSPMLLVEGAAQQIEDDGDRSRRTVIGLDGQGRLLLIVSSWPTFTLSGLGEWLQQSGLDLVTALNLDGGSSTGIYLQTPDKPLLIDSIVRVPAVLVVEPI
jgi:exopolysaccharide biosynthesis protein